MIWNRPSRLDRIEANLETLSERVAANAEQIQFLSEISNATNRRIDRFVEATDNQLQEMRAQTAQMQKALEYLLSKDG